jgi:hypothetical protein
LITLKIHMVSIEGSIYQNKEQAKEYPLMCDVVVSGRARVLLRGGEKL